MLYSVVMVKNKKLNKKQYAYQVIRNRIIEGTYAPGQRIIIDQIAKEVESSHIPVREAIHQLESEELIDYQPNIGAIVKGINDALYVNTLQVLALLEGYATALSAQHISQEGLQHLYEINEQMDEQLKSYALDKFSESNRNFHFYIYSFCPNELLITKITEMWERLDVVRRSGFHFFPNRSPHSVKEHIEIIKLMKNNVDSDTIEQYTRNHKLNTLKAFKHRNNL